MLFLVIPGAAFAAVSPPGVAAAGTLAAASTTSAATTSTARLFMSSPCEDAADGCVSAQDRFKTETGKVRKRTGPAEPAPSEVRFGVRLARLHQRADLGPAAALVANHLHLVE